MRDLRGLRLTADATLAEAPQLDVLHVPGGFGQEALMEDEEVIGWFRRQAAGATVIFSVCTGALLCGAAGLIQGPPAPPPTGQPSRSWSISAPSRSTSVSWWTATWSSPQA